jgi:hypothetical protein
MKTLDQKRKEAEARQRDRDKRGDKAQLAYLPINGESKREIARLTNRLSNREKVALKKV